MTPTRPHLAASLRISKGAEIADRRVEIEPHGAWRGSPHVGYWSVAYAVSLAVRRLRRVRSWDVATLVRGTSGAWKESCRTVEPSREAAERAALEALLGSAP